MHNLTIEQIEHVRNWITGLRSGKYVQGRGVLTQVVSTAVYEEDCCLGVLCKVLQLPRVLSLDESCILYGSSSQSSVLPQEAQQAVGFVTANGIFNPGQAKNPDIDIVSLTGLNDQGATFAEIADILERNLVDNQDKIFTEDPIV